MSQLRGWSCWTAVVLLVLLVRASGVEAVKNETDGGSSTSPVAGGHTVAIIGGEEALKSDYPWLAQLLAADSTPFCGATLIHPRFLLTAKHCLRGIMGVPALNKIVLGNKRFNMNDLATYHRHPALDVAMIELKRPVHNVKPVTLARSKRGHLAATCGLEKDGTTLRVAGWGRTSNFDTSSSKKLMYVDVPVVNQKTCETAMIGHPKKVRRSEMCAGLKVGGKDACKGDSGGPLFKWDEETKSAVQVGVVSWGSQTCGMPGKYGVYARVSYARKWMKSVMGGSELNSLEKFRCTGNLH